MIYSRNLNFTAFLRVPGIPGTRDLSHYEMPDIPGKKEGDAETSPIGLLPLQALWLLPSIAISSSVALLIYYVIYCSTTNRKNNLFQLLFPAVSQKYLLLIHATLQALFLSPLQQETEKLKQTFYKGND